EDFAGRSNQPVREKAREYVAPGTNGFDVLVESHSFHHEGHRKAVRQDQPSDNDQHCVGFDGTGTELQPLFGYVVLGIRQLEHLHVLGTDPRNLTAPVVAVGLVRRSAAGPFAHATEWDGRPFIRHTPPPSADAEAAAPPPRVPPPPRQARAAPPLRRSPPPARRCPRSAGCSGCTRSPPPSRCLPP